MIQFDLIHDNPYRFTQEDILWMAHVVHKDLPESLQTSNHRADFFNRGQPCLRSSSLAKRYGWGFHLDTEGRVALVPMGSAQYAEFLNDPKLKHLPAMRNRRASATS